MSNANVLVIHPARQHSHQLAMGLAKANMLYGYWTGSPCFEKQRGLIPRFLWNKWIRRDCLEIDESLVKWNPVGPIFQKFAARFPPTLAGYFQYLGYLVFDSWAARRLLNLKQKPAIVIGYETACLQTFLTAKKLGIKTVLDAAAVHHVMQDKFSNVGYAQWLHKKILNIKEKEIDLSERMIVPSELALKCYADAGVPKEKLYKVLLGTDLRIFKPEENKPGDSFTFIFSGVLSKQKGLDKILMIYDKVSKQHPNSRLWLFGSRGDIDLLPYKKLYPKVKWFGRVGEKELSYYYRNADCLILFSKHDSFGLVVAEGLASGVPVIVSDQVGAKELIRNGDNGWIIPHDDMQELDKRMMWCAEHFQEVRNMRKTCRESVLNFSWEHYHLNIIRVINDVVGEKAERKILWSNG